jgi:hypothetical protein
MSLITSVCPQCKIKYINDDTIAGFNWFCSVSCERSGRKIAREITKPDLFEDITDKIEEVWDSELFKIK